MTIKEVKEYLLQIKKIDKMIENKIAEKDQWRLIATGVTAAPDNERVKSSGSQQKMESAICRYMDIEKEIDASVDELIEKKKEVIGVIEQLPVAEYDILHKVYIQYMNFYEIAENYDKTYSWVTTVHGRALNDLKRMLEGGAV